MTSAYTKSFRGPMVRIPPFQGGGSCSIHGGCSTAMSKHCFAVVDGGGGDGVGEVFEVWALATFPRVETHGPAL